MKAISLTLNLALFSLILSAQALGADLAINTVGLYKVSGQHSSWGNYSGLLLIKADHSVQRWIKFSFPLSSAPARKSLGLVSEKNETIEELWTGQINGSELEFKIQASQVLTQANETVLTSSDLQSVLVSIELGKANFSIPLDGNYSEVYEFISSDTTNIYDDEVRTLEDATGNVGSPLISIAEKLGLNKVIDEYRKLSFLNPWKSRPEFRQNQQFQIRDYTDLQFYRENNASLRLRNLSLNEVALAEAQERRQAFAPTLAEKARQMDELTSTLNLNELGILEMAHVNEEGQLQSRSPEGDAALWTAMYAWSQLLRWQVTGEAQAYENFQKSIVGITHLLRISKDPSRFARYIYYSPASELTKDPAMVQGAGEYANYKFNSNSNNDMSKGVLFALTLAFKGLKVEDVQTRQQVLAVIPRMLQAKAIGGDSFNAALAKGVQALWTDDVNAAKQFGKGLSTKMNSIGDHYNVGSGFHIGGIEDASGDHLTMVSSLIEYMVADILVNDQRFGNNKDYSWAKNEAQKNLRNIGPRLAKANHGFFSLVGLAVTGDSSLRQLSQAAIQQLIEIPNERPVGELIADMTLRPEWSYSSWPAFPWKALKGPWMVDSKKLQADNQKQGAYGYPIYEGLGFTSTYYWKDHTNGSHFSGSRKIQRFYADYLWVYWLARSSQLLQPGQ